MNNIKTKDLKIKESKKWTPKFLGMKRDDIFRIEAGDDNIYGYNEDGREVYYEDSGGYWRKREYKDGEEVYCENNYGYWWKKKYKDGKQVYYEDSNGNWEKREYKDGNEVYHENSYGYWSKSKYKDGKEVYYENSNGYWRKRDNINTIEYQNGKYYLNGEEAELI